jgi:long-chain acyl-CoA synthetase
VEQVKKFRILPKELDPEEGDTTPTRKIKRKHLYALFEPLIDEMYGEDVAATTNGGVSGGSRQSNQKIHA